MIEPVRGKIDAFEVDCCACGVVERIEGVRYSQILPRLRALGWRILAGRHYCPTCEAAAA